MNEILIGVAVAVVLLLVIVLIGYVTVSYTHLGVSFFINKPTAKIKKGER